MRIQQLPIYLLFVVCAGTLVGLGAGEIYDYITEQQETRDAMERATIPDASIAINDGAVLDINTFSGGSGGGLAERPRRLPGATAPQGAGLLMAAEAAIRGSHEDGRYNGGTGGNPSRATVKAGKGYAVVETTY